MGFLDGFAPMAHWALRIALASVFLYHGINKFPVQEFAGLSLLVSWLVFLAEIGAGVLLLLGGFLKDWMTRLGALFAIIVMVGAIAIVHWPNGWGGDGGMEFQVVLLLVALYVLIKGNRINDPGMRMIHDADRVTTDGNRVDTA